MNNPYLNMFNNNTYTPPINNSLLKNPMDSLGTAKNTLNLNQIENFQPVKKFKDDSNTEWTLVKSSFDSTVDIPDPRGIQVVDFWNHEFPNLKTKLYVYVVEGIKQPRVETEQPTRVMYQWFSLVFVPTFTPSMITDKEWLKANVYAAPIINARVSKLKAICHITNTVSAVPTPDDRCIQVEELDAGNTGCSEGQCNEG